LPVGAADFFRALLELELAGTASTRRRAEQMAPTDGSTIFVCGSRTAWQTGRRDEFARGRIPVHSMPVELTKRVIDDGALHEWADAIVRSLHEHSVLALAIGDAPSAYVVAAAALTARLADVVALVHERETIERLYLEGGDTAAAVVSALGFDRFHAEASPGAGVGALRPIARTGPLLLVKPGSYPWPAGVISGMIP
jgi:uncharacterized protein YgbK (DUF1537 family)